MKLVGLHKKDSSYDGDIYKCVLDLIKTHTKYGHSGGSHSLTLSVFNKVVNFENLSPLTNNLKEWMYVSEKVWQSTRCSSAFSEDCGRTWYSVNDKNRKIHKSKEFVG
jgi:hypothetical protein